MRPGHSVSLLQGKTKICYITGRTDGLHKHHIFGGPRRAISDKHGFWVWLRPEWHNVAPYSIHQGGWQLRRKLQDECQRKYLEAHTMAEWMALMGKNYLLEDDHGENDQ